jgi:hypothetical protein
MAVVVEDTSSVMEAVAEQSHLAAGTAEMRSYLVAETDEVDCSHPAPGMTVRGPSPAVRAVEERSHVAARIAEMRSYLVARTAEAHRSHLAPGMAAGLDRVAARTMPGHSQWCHMAIVKANAKANASADAGGDQTWLPGSCELVSMRAHSLEAVWRTAECGGEGLWRESVRAALRAIAKEVEARAELATTGLVPCCGRTVSVTTRSMMAGYCHRCASE